MPVHLGIRKLALEKTEAEYPSLLYPFAYIA